MTVYQNEPTLQMPLRVSSKKVWFFMIAMQNIFVALTYPSLYR